MQSWTSFFRRAVVAGVCLSGVLALGCAGRNRDQLDGYPSQPGRQIIAQPGGYDDVYIADQQYVEQPAADGRQVVGYDQLSDGTQVEVVQYVHTYPDPIETYPRVYWAGNWYYNINGDFVYWNQGYGGWAYYWGPPAPLVSCWNMYYPWSPYYWGVGFYGAGWYWGGVGYYGYHAYGVPVVNVYNTHHQYWADSNPGGPSGRPSSGHPGGPTNDPSPGGSTNDGPPRRTKPTQDPVAHRTLPGDTSPARGEPARRDGSPTAAPTGDRVAGAAPQRTSTAPQRTSPQRTVPVRSYTTAGGQRVTTIDPRGPVASRTPTAPTRTSKSLGTVTSGPARDPFAQGGNTPRWDQPVAASAPTRNAGWSGSTSPSRSFSPSQSAPSRSFSPSQSAPSRSFSPSHSAPSRSVSPPSHSAPSRSFSPSHSSGGSRSMSPPSRSSAPSRSFSPSHSSGGGSRSFSPSRSSGGGGHHSAPVRSSGGGGGGHHSGGGGRHR